MPDWFFPMPLAPNAGRQARLKAGATQERTLEAVACTPMLGPVLAQGPGETVLTPCPFLPPVI